MEKNSNEPIEPDGMKLADLLLREIQFYREDCRKTDDKSFNLITIVLVPFLILLGYTLIKPQYSAFVLVVPYFSLCGVLLYLSILIRYAINGIYLKYLERRLNTTLGIEVFIGEKLAQTFYVKGFSVVNAGIAIIIIGIIFINLALVPAINQQITFNAIELRFPIPLSKSTYWFGLLALLLYVLAAIYFQYSRKWEECEKYVAKTESSLDKRGSTHIN